MENSAGQHSDPKALVGRKVMCINDDFSNVQAGLRSGFSFPVLGSYTVRGVIGDTFLLNEIVNPEVQWPPASGSDNGELSFDCWRFSIWETAPAENLDDEMDHIRSRISYALALLNARTSHQYTMRNLPGDHEAGTGISKLLSELRADINEYRRLLHSRDQQNLSAYMKALRGEGEMTEELHRWWMNRY